MSYQGLDAGVPVGPGIPMAVVEGHLSSSKGTERMSRERTAAAPTLPGVSVTQAQTYINERRVLVVSYNTNEPPGTLGYSVVVRPGHAVGDHYHHHREERVLLLHGRGEFRLLDQRPDSPTRGVLNVFSLDHPGVCVLIPVGVAHAILAEGTLTVLQVLASSDYDPADDFHVSLSHLEWE